MSAIEDLLETMARLRAPNGCPWDIEQTHQSLARCLIDECCELLETLDTLDMDHMREELGDVLLQVVFHAQMAKEAGLFDFEAVAAEINEKLVRRHPHVFGSNTLQTSGEVLHQWDQIKAQEKAGKVTTSESTVFKNLPPVLPSLIYAEEIFKQIQKKELATGPSLDLEGIEAVASDLDEETAGQILFEIAAACRLKGIDSESALRRYAQNVRGETEGLAMAENA